MTTESHDDSRAGKPVALGSTDGLGPLPEPQPRPGPDRLCGYSAQQMREYATQAVAAARERLCAAIKAADDKAISEAGYMLDSDDCISVIRGTWNPGA